jgi:hypothetical protein
VPLRQLERESYDRFAKIKDTLTQQESESPPARIVAVARPPLTPSSPRRLVVGLLALGGLFLGLALALLSEHSARARLTEREVPARVMKRRPRAAAASGTTFNLLIAAVGAPLARVLKPSHRNLSPRMKALRCGAGASQNGTTVKESENGVVLGRTSRPAVAQPAAGGCWRGQEIA